jgi:hypothetical protein
VIAGRRVFSVGDSFVAGVGDPDQRGWVGRLAARSHRDGAPITAYNLGVRRDTSDEVCRRWASEVAVRRAMSCDERLGVAAAQSPAGGRGWAWISVVTRLPGRCRPHAAQSHGDRVDLVVGHHRERRGVGVHAHRGRRRRIDDVVHMPEPESLATPRAHRPTPDPTAMRGPTLLRQDPADHGQRTEGPRGRGHIGVRLRRKRRRSRPEHRTISTYATKRSAGTSARERRPEHLRGLPGRLAGGSLNWA